MKAGAARAAARGSLPRSIAKRRAARIGARPRRVNVAVAVTVSRSARRRARSPGRGQAERIVPVRASANAWRPRAIVVAVGAPADVGAAGRQALDRQRDAAAREQRVDVARLAARREPAARARP